MEQIDEPSAAFAFLRPACVLLTREQTAENARRLDEQLRRVDDGVLQQLQEYVLFPLRFVLKTPGPKKEGLVLAALEGVAAVLSRTCVRSWDVLRELFSELCLCLGSPADPGTPAPSSEEVKVAALRGLSALLHAAYGDVVCRLYEPAMLPGLGAAVSLLLALAERERAREVQSAALKCLQALLRRCDCPEEHVPMGPGEEWALGAAFASFLPGIALALSRVVAGDVRQGHEVTTRAVRVWYRTVGLVMSDDQLTDSHASELPAAQPGRAGELVVRRTAEWAKGTLEKLAVILKRILSWTSAHQHWRVRLEAVSLADHLLSTSRRSLNGCIGPLLDALVTMANDEDPVVRDRCGAALENVARASRERNGQTFADVLSENLHALATSLPRLMRTSDDRRKLAILGAFAGYLRILGPGVEAVLNSAAHLHRVSRALLQVLELDVSDVRVVEERAAPDPVGGGADVRVVEERAAPDPLGGGADVRVVEERAAPDPLGGGDGGGAGVRVVEERAALDPVGGGDGGGAGEVPVRKKKSFVYFTDEKVFSSLQDVCRLLGYYGNLYLLVDHFLDLYRESLAYRKQAAIVLNEIITGAAGIGVDAARELVPVSRDDLKAVVTLVIEEYTSPDNWHLPTSIEDSDQGEQAHFGQSRMLSITNRAEGELKNFPTGRKGSTVHQLNSNIWQICSQLEGIGCMALAVGMGFRPLLMTMLYPVLEKAGDRTLLISQSALASLTDISRACGYASLRDLVVENSDYLLSDVALNLQRLGRRPQAPRVLAVMLAHADAGLLPLVRDVLRDVLAALDQSYDERADVFCLVLHAVLKAVVRWFPATGGPPGQGGAQGAEPREAETLDVRRFLLDYLREKRLAEGIVGEEEEAEDTEVPPRLEQNDADADFPDEKAKLPSHIAMTKEVMERCVHLLSHPSLPIRLKVLDVLELCVRVLSSQENELLPLAHRCWPALLRRLTGDDPVAVLRAFPVLCTLGETCGDFLRKRVSKEVLPNLTGSLRRQAPVSARAGPVYTHTLAYKLQAAVLQGLGPLCLRLGLVDSDLESVAEACLPYLSSRQPPKLQEACISVFQHLIRVDPDAMWLTLNELHCPLAYLPPHPALRPVTLTGMGQPRTEYTDNVLKLLQDIR